MTVTVPQGTDLTAILTQLDLSDGATSNVGTDPHDYDDGPKTVIVTAEDGVTTKTWTIIAVEQEPAPAPETTPE